MLWCNQPLQNPTELQHHIDLFCRLTRTKQLTHTFFYGPVGTGKSTIIQFYLQHLFSNSIKYNTIKLQIPKKKKELSIKDVINPIELNYQRSIPYMVLNYNKTPH